MKLKVLRLFYKKDETNHDIDHSSHRQQGAVRYLWNINMHQTRMLSSILAIQHLFCNDAAGSLQRLRPWSAHSDSHQWQCIQFAETTGTKTFSALMHNLLYADDLVTVNVCPLWI